MIGTSAHGGAKWFQLMLLACVSNGIGAFGLKVLAEMGFTEHYETQYLFFWYLGWLVFSGVVLIRRPLLPYRREVLIGAGMGLCSMCGQFFVGLALSHDVAGHVVFSVSTGGTLFVVALAGVLAFREKVGPYGLAGLVIGFLSIVILSVV
jgi:drug/metabolite transporter (DMT)-like permease